MSKETHAARAEQTDRRALVTGGSGFIGTHLVTALAGRGYQVSNLDIRPPNVDAHRACWTQLDILDEDRLADHWRFFRPTVVFNLAAIADFSLGMEALEVNTAGLRNVLRLCQKTHPQPRLVHTSTQMIAKPGYKIAGPRDYDPYTEYGQSKADSEEILYEEGGGIVWTIVRPTMIWGPWHRKLADSTWRYLNRRWYMVVSGKDPLRNYGYVKNLVAQLVAIGEAGENAVAGGMFYGGDPSMPTSRWIDGFSTALSGKRARRVPYSALKALSWIGELSGRLGGPSPINSGRLYRMTSEYVADIEPTRDALNYSVIPLEQGIAETVAWLRDYDPAEYARK